MKRKTWISIMILFLIVVWLIWLFERKEISKICCEGVCFDIEIAQTSSQRQQGLMWRESLPDNQGMLFVFPEEAIHSFRMKNTLIPLDMLRLSSWLQIIDIQEAIPCESDPCPSYTPSATAQYVLELNQGISKKNWIKIWNQCFLSFTFS